MPTLFIFLKEFVFASFWTCWVASFIESGKTLIEASYSLGIFFLSIALLEVPTGYVADRFGKKLSSLSGMVLVSLGFLINGLDLPDFLGLFSFGLAGLGFTLMSGASMAWLYNLARKEAFFQHEGFFFRVEMIGRVATFIGSFVSVYLLQLNPKFVWIGISSIGIIAFIIGFKLPSDKGNDHIEVPSLKILLDSLESLKTPAIFWLMMASVFFGIESSIRNVIYQPYVISLNAGNVWYLAIFQSTLAVSRMLGITFYQKKLSSLNKSIGFAAFSMVAFSLAEFIASQVTSFLVFVCFYAFAIFTLGWFFPIKDSHLNKHLSDTSRATVLSMNSMAENLFSAFGCFVLSTKLSNSALNQFWSYGGIFLLLTALAVYLSSSSKKEPVKLDGMRP
jgi:MFS family permease